MFQLISASFSPEHSMDTNLLRLASKILRHKRCNFENSEENTMVDDITLETVHLPMSLHRSSHKRV